MINSITSGALCPKEGDAIADKLTPVMLDFVQTCLTHEASDRPAPRALLSHPLISGGGGGAGGAGGEGSSAAAAAAAPEATSSPVIVMPDLAPVAAWVSSLLDSSGNAGTETSGGVASGSSTVVHEA